MTTVSLHWGRKCSMVLAVGAVETDPISWWSLIAVPAVGKSVLDIALNCAAVMDTACVVCLHGDMTFLHIS